ncbi:GIY-YIG nuclease family protein [Parvularcula marina]|uniref:GIY-YIG nuclease family protein n=1 Tax=Parvularcula marina TaxID=2292771 RepID=UPI0035158961
MAFYVYMVTNRPGGVIYTGHTEDIENRTWEHREQIRKGFASKYNCSRLVWYEIHEAREDAFTRERQIKKWNRAWKMRLIEEANPDWDDLFNSLFG